MSSKYLLTTVRRLQTVPHQSDSYARIFVNNLPWTVSNKELSQYFSQFGNIVESSVRFDDVTKISRSFGFVLFASRSGYENALNAKVHLLEGRLLQVEPSTKIDPRKGR